MSTIAQIEGHSLSKYVHSSGYFTQVSQTAFNYAKFLASKTANGK